MRWALVCKYPISLRISASASSRGGGHPLQPPDDAGDLAKIQPRHRRFNPARLLVLLRVLQLRHLVDALRAVIIVQDFFARGERGLQMRPEPFRPIP